MSNGMMNSYQGLQQNAMPQPQPQPPMGMAAPGMAQPDPMQQQGALNPQLVQSILAMQQQGAQRNQIERQRQLADMMRADATRGLEGRQAGRVYVPPGVANLGAALLAGYKGRKLNDDADVREMNLGAQRQGAMTDFFNAATGRKRPALPHMGDEGE
jgi:hypothetical protein